MKDLNDVLTYLNNILGPTHDLTVALRTHIIDNNNEQIKISIDPLLLKHLRNKIESFLERPITDYEFESWLETECDFWLKGSVNEFEEGFEDSLDCITNL